jgi:hypothetical protein
VGRIRWWTNDTTATSPDILGIRTTWSIWLYCTSFLWRSSVVLNSSSLKLLKTEQSFSTLMKSLQIFSNHEQTCNDITKYHEYYQFDDLARCLGTSSAGSKLQTLTPRSPSILPASKHIISSSFHSFISRFTVSFVITHLKRTLVLHSHHSH